MPATPKSSDNPKGSNTTNTTASASGAAPPSTSAAATHPPSTPSTTAKDNGGHPTNPSSSGGTSIPASILGNVTNATTTTSASGSGSDSLAGITSSADQTAAILTYLQRRGFTRAEAAFKAEIDAFVTGATPEQAAAAADVHGRPPTVSLEDLAAKNSPRDLTRDHDRDADDKDSANSNSKDKDKPSSKPTAKELNGDDVFGSNGTAHANPNPEDGDASSAAAQALLLDPTDRARGFNMLRSWCQGSLDIYQQELLPILLPLFVHSFLDLVSMGYADAASAFYTAHASSFLPTHTALLSQIRSLALPSHILSDPLAHRFRTERYVLKMSNTVFSLLLGWLTDGSGPAAATSVALDEAQAPARRGREAMLKVVNERCRIQVLAAQPYQIDAAILEEGTGLTGAGPSYSSHPSGPSNRSRHHPALSKDAVSDADAVAEFNAKAAGPQLKLHPTVPLSERLQNEVDKELQEAERRQRDEAAAIQQLQQQQQQQEEQKPQQLQPTSQETASATSTQPTQDPNASTQGAESGAAPSTAPTDPMTQQANDGDTTMEDVSTATAKPSDSAPSPAATTAATAGTGAAGEQAGRASSVAGGSSEAASAAPAAATAAAAASATSTSASGHWTASLGPDYSAGLLAAQLSDLPPQAPTFRTVDVKREVQRVKDARKRIRLDPSLLNAAAPGGSNGSGAPPPFSSGVRDGKVNALGEEGARAARVAALPSVCAYTYHDADDGVTCSTFSPDVSLMAAGFEESFVQVWSLKGERLRGLRGDPNLSGVRDGRTLRKQREGQAYTTRKLVGHSGPVYGVDFDPIGGSASAPRHLLSSSADGTARLWSLDTFSALVAYRGHQHPVWDVKWSPLGTYFATASADKTARLWSTERINPLRMYAGHLSDVDCLTFHPNSLYLATGSSDRTVRLWDVQRGACVRLFVGHQSPLSCLCISPDGRYLATASCGEGTASHFPRTDADPQLHDASISLWDLASGRRIKKMWGHRHRVHAMDFSKDGSTLVSAGRDSTVRCWDVRAVGGARGGVAAPSFLAGGTGGVDGVGAGGLAAAAAAVVAGGGGATGTGTGTGTGQREAVRPRAGTDLASSEDCVATFWTKRTPLVDVRFTERNLCLVAGVYEEE